ncbi:MAG: glycosyltransferase family 2 protein [Chloroflexi bacterium]|nr:glycosyltransferase family 2 protein [Chloroflexota bacterium]
MKLSVIMPVYNEADTIAEILQRVTDVPVNKEIVLVDDCSKDGTSDILKRLGHIPNLRVITHDVNGGKGAAVQTALRHVTGDIVVIQDADLEYDPNDYHKLIEPITSGQTKVVYGVRNLGTQKWYMALGNRFLTLITNLLYGVKLRDMETCYKTMAREVVQGMRLECRRFDVEAEITAKIVRRGYGIVEIPISYTARHEQKKLSPLDGWPAIRALLKYRFGRM